jgi:hypothetical protein
MNDRVPRATLAQAQDRCSILFFHRSPPAQPIGSDAASVTPASSPSRIVPEMTLVPRNLQAQDDPHRSRALPVQLSSATVAETEDVTDTSGVCGHVFTDQRFSAPEIG